MVQERTTRVSRAALVTIGALVLLTPAARFFGGLWLVLQGVKKPEPGDEPPAEPDRPDEQPT